MRIFKFLILMSILLIFTSSCVIVKEKVESVSFEQVLNNSLNIESFNIQANLKMTTYSADSKIVSNIIYDVTKDENQNVYSIEYFGALGNYIYEETYHILNDDLLTIITGYSDDDYWYYESYDTEKEKFNKTYVNFFDIDNITYVEVKSDIENYKKYKVELDYEKMTFNDDFAGEHQILEKIKEKNIPLFYYVKDDYVRIIKADLQDTMNDYLEKYDIEFLEGMSIDKSECELTINVLRINQVEKLELPSEIEQIVADELQDYRPSSV